jgi:sodium pump decarboxylase gamma subunit
MFTQSMSLMDKLLNGIGITILGMGVVFAVLIILSFLLDALRVISGENKKKDSPSKEPVSKNIVEAARAVQENDDDDELVAVIAAAIAAISGSSIEDFMVKSINPVPQKNNVWASVGRQQQMLERL